MGKKGIDKAKFGYYMKYFVSKYKQLEDCRYIYIQRRQ